ncbi:MAG: dienelactone hydrolase family protein [Verrucomicrobiaceae bacterium]|nr:dienelactone hydrolase family protein [Verrucomicrobiaceae bacterium]
MRKRYRALLFATSLLILLGVAIQHARSTVPPTLVDGVTKENVKWETSEGDVSTYVYYPALPKDAPVVIVVHGFTRSRRYMAGWGVHLARQGFVVVVPTQPFFSNHVRNGRALAGIVKSIRAGTKNLRSADANSVGLVGFSMGGLTTLLAAKQEKVQAWVGLDPVDMNGMGRQVAGSLRSPCAVLKAEPGMWNMHGNANAMIEAIKAPKLAFKVVGSKHLAPEEPTDLLGQLACGFKDHKTTVLFRDYTTDFLKAVLKNDPEALARLRNAGKDAGLAEVVNTFN